MSNYKNRRWGILFGNAKKSSHQLLEIPFEKKKNWKESSKVLYFVTKLHDEWLKNTINKSLNKNLALA